MVVKKKSSERSKKMLWRRKSNERKEKKIRLHQFQFWKPKDTVFSSSSLSSP